MYQFYDVVWLSQSGECDVDYDSVCLTRASLLVSYSLIAVKRQCQLTCSCFDAELRVPKLASWVVGGILNSTI